MDFFTHLVFGIGVGKTITKNSNAQKAFIIGSIAPDSDVFISWIPDLFPQLFFLSHRGLFHSVFALPFLMAFLIYITKYFSESINFNTTKELFELGKVDLSTHSLLVGVGGSISHIMLDFLNPQGVVLFYPFISTRFSSGTIIFFDLFVSTSATLLILWICFKHFIKRRSLTTIKIVPYARFVVVLLAFVLAIYGSLQFNSINSQSISNSTPSFVPVDRWFITENSTSYNAILFNQISQDILFEFSFLKVIFNSSSISESETTTILNQVKATTEYNDLLFNLDVGTNLLFNITLNTEKDVWDIHISDVIDEAQKKIFDFSSFRDTRNLIQVPV